MREKAEQHAFEAEFGWMKEADHSMFGHGQYPVPWKPFVADSETNGEVHFKAIEQRKPPEDQNRPSGETFMGATVVVGIGHRLQPSGMSIGPFVL
jgi:hypothetical protein